jgi:hypothetical protein
MRERTTTSVILLIIGILAFVRFGIALKKDLDVNLSEVQQVVGTVMETAVINIPKIVFKGSSTKRVFYFKLAGNDQKFVIERDEGGYFDLQRNITIGDTLRVFYYSNTADYNSRVYQVEENSSVITSYKDYEERQSKWVTIILFIGVILITGALFYYFKLSPIKLLDSLVNKKND